MTDLSQLLGDLYADDTPAAKAPEWSSAEALDEVFSTWVPGPSEDASSAERSVVAGAADEPAVEPVDDAFAWGDVDEVASTVELDAAPVAVLTRRWSPTDDDILPTRKPRGRRR